MNSIQNIGRPKDWKTSSLIAPLNLARFTQVSEKKDSTERFFSIIEKMIEKSPDPLKTIIDGIVDAIRGRQEELKIEYRITKMTLIGFFLLMGGILAATTVMTTMNKMTGETAAFIFGTAFGSIITFLYKFLLPRPEPE